MADTLVILFPLWAVAAQLTSLVLGLRGVYSLIRGKVELRGSHLRGQDARLVAIVLLGQLVLAFIVVWRLHEALHWGRSGDLRTSLESHFGNALIFTVAAGGAYLWAFLFARARTSAA